MAEVFVDLDVYEVAGLVQQVGALLAEIDQVKALAQAAVALGEGVDGHYARVVVNASVMEVDDHIVGILRL